jgi:hypothetical protein
MESGHWYCQCRSAGPCLKGEEGCLVEESRNFQNRRLRQRGCLRATVGEKRCQLTDSEGVFRRWTDPGLGQAHRRSRQKPRLVLFDC